MPTTAVAAELFQGASGSAFPSAFSVLSGTATQQAGRGQLAPPAGAGAAAVAVFAPPVNTGDLYGPVVSGDAPTAWFRFADLTDETGGSNLTLNTQSPTTATSLVPTSPTTSADFDGVDDGLIVPNQAKLNYLSAFTVEAWVTLDSAPPVGAARSIVWGSNYQYGLRVLDNRSVQFAVRMPEAGGFGHYNAISSVTLNVGQRYHLVGTHDGSTVRLYIDGVLAASVPSGALFVATDHGVRIAHEPFGGERWTGRIDELALYNKALSVAQVVDHYAAASPPGLTDAEVLVDWAFGNVSVAQTAIVGLRSNGVQANAAGIPASGYYLEVDPVADTVRLMRSEGAGTQVELWSAPTFAWTDNVPGFIRFRAENTAGGVILSVKLWQGSGEPPSWVVHTDTDATQVRSGGNVWLAQRNGPVATARVGSVGDLLLSRIDPHRSGVQMDSLTLPHLAAGAPTAPAAGQQVLYATATGLRTETSTADASVYPAASAGAPAVQTFTGNGTWTKPAGAKWVEIIAIGGGGGGGGGGNSGGGGGGGGSRNRVIVPASSLNASESVVVGGGGAGATGGTGALGQTGARGGDSSFGGTVCRGLGGHAGQRASGSSVAPNPGGAGGAGWGSGGFGAQSTSTGNGGNGEAYLPPEFGCGGGGGGSWQAASYGAWGAANYFYPGMGEGGQYGVNAGNAGSAGGSQPTNKPWPGAGGGGGRGTSVTGGIGGTGGAGGRYGGGGGGGGGGGAGGSGRGGNGGVGAPGIVVVISYFS